MEAYIILDKEYSDSDPNYVTQLACSTSDFGDSCIHTDEQLYNFYKDRETHEILFIGKSKNDPRLINIIEKLYKEKDKTVRAYKSVLSALNKLNIYYE